jgi:hypothetical protein
VEAGEPRSPSSTKPAPAPEKRRRWQRFRRVVRERYTTIDPRTAGLFRVVLGALTSLDLLRHASEARFLYSNEGVLSNHAHLYRPSSGNQLSLFHAFSTLGEVKLLFVLGLVAHLALLVGYRSRLAAFASFVFVTSMDQRIPLVENGGYVVVNLLLFYACFLPIGQRFSVDAWRASWRARKETNVAELADHRDASGERQTMVTFAYLLTLLNLGFVYFFNVVNKSGKIWRSGDTVHYVLHIDRMVTGIAVFLREHLPEVLMIPSSWVVLSVEAVIMGCIWSPYGRKWARPLAMLLMAGLHGTFGVMMRLGPFSWFMIGWSTLLLLPVHFDALTAWYAKRTRGVVLGIDERSALALAVGRIAKRLDGAKRVRFEPIESASVGHSLAVRDESEGRPWSKEPGAIVSRLCEAVPFGRHAELALAITTLGLSRWWMRRAIRREEATTRFFGLDTQPAREPASPAPLELFAAKWSGRVREGFLGLMALAFAMQAWNENKALPKQIKFEQPKLQQMLIGYPRLFQGWGMFAPNPIQEDGILVVDAWTTDGRRFDPFTAEPAIMDLSTVRGAGLSQLRQDYGNRIRLDRNATYRDGLKDYLRRWHEQTGRPEDELVAFDIYWLRDKCPPPGTDVPIQNDPVPIATWRKPGGAKLPDGSRIPASPRLRSAEKWPGEEEKK